MAKTTEDKLRALLTSKENIRKAIESKGVECGTDVPLSHYCNKIQQIQNFKGLRLKGILLSESFSGVFTVSRT